MFCGIVLCKILCKVLLGWEIERLERRLGGEIGEGEGGSGRRTERERERLGLGRDWDLGWTELDW